MWWIREIWWAQHSFWPQNKFLPKTEFLQVVDAGSHVFAHFPKSVNKLGFRIGNGSFCLISSVFLLLFFYIFLVFIRAKPLWRPVCPWKQNQFYKVGLNIPNITWNCVNSPCQKNTIVQYTWKTTGHIKIVSPAQQILVTNTLDWGTAHLLVFWT